MSDNRAINASWDNSFPAKAWKATKDAGQNVYDAVGGAASAAGRGASALGHGIADLGAIPVMMIQAEAQRLAAHPELVEQANQATLAKLRGVQESGTQLAGGALQKARSAWEELLLRGQPSQHGVAEGE